MTPAESILQEIMEARAEQLSMYDHENPGTKEEQRKADVRWCRALEQGGVWLDQFNLQLKYGETTKEIEETKLIDKPNAQ